MLTLNDRSYLNYGFTVAHSTHQSLRLRRLSVNIQSQPFGVFLLNTIYVLLDKIIDITTQIRITKYPTAKVIFLAGSIVRGEATPFSDLDLVVVFEKLPTACRESFYFGGFPVEAFVHDPETLNYFITERERTAGVCTMPEPRTLVRVMFA